MTLVSLFLIFKADFSSAVPQVAVVTRTSPGNGASDIPVTAYFEWNEIANATKYILEIDEFAEEQDNIAASTYCSAGACSFGFLDLTIGSIEEGSPGDPQTYYWKVRGANNDGDGLAQSDWWSFTTEIATEPPPPPPDGDGGPPAELTPPIAAETLAELFTAIINFLFYLVIALVPLMIIWAAFLILTAAGKAEQVNKGKTIILWTLVAIAIVLLAKGLPSVVKGILGG